MDFIEEQTAGATFCRRSDKVQEEKGGNSQSSLSSVQPRQEQEIITLIAVDGGWSEWSRFAGCTKSCGGGSKSRTRECNEPSPSDGGADCPGKYFENLECNTEQCQSEKQINKF